jgi:tRNA (mo5U34)-methyltransferase
VGTFDGFWAFELERRGAEVVAIDVDDFGDLDWPPLQRASVLRETQEMGVELGRGFKLAAELRGSKARRVSCNVYDLTPEAIGGPVDLAFVGTLLIHLRDPVRALERVRRALAPGGELYVLDVVSLRDTVRSPRKPRARLEVLHTRSTGGDRTRRRCAIGCGPPASRT